MNRFMLNSGLPLVVIDRKLILQQDVIKNDALTVKMQHLLEGKVDRDFEGYRLVIIEMDSWDFVYFHSTMELEGSSKFQIIKYQPGTIGRISPLMQACSN